MSNVIAKALFKMQLYVFLSGTIKNCRSIVLVSLPSPSVTINLMYSHGRVTVSLKAGRLEHSYYLDCI